MPSLWDAFADLRLQIDDYAVQRRELEVSSEFTRVTSTVVLHGDGDAGEGEDVTYTADDHDDFPAGLMLSGTWTLHEYSTRLDELELWSREPAMAAALDYRRWAFESAALDLALRQAGRSLADAVGRAFAPVRFVVSTRRELPLYRELYPDLEFKLDVESDWDRALMEPLAATDSVRVLDLKAYYRGTSVDLAPDPELYRTVAGVFADAVIEDPWLEDGCREALAGAEARLSFDAPIHSWADVGKLAVEPRWLNIKPSRFGTLRGLLECIEHCEDDGIRMYGGGQFELGPGRRQIQRLASVFYADGPNDVAPSEWNEGPPQPGMQTSPLAPPAGGGF
jgi:hypothetical protein